MEKSKKVKHLYFKVIFMFVCMLVVFSTAWVTVLKRQMDRDISHPFQAAKRATEPEKILAAVNQTVEGMRKHDTDACTKVHPKLIALTDIQDRLEKVIANKTVLTEGSFLKIKLDLQLMSDPTMSRFSQKHAFLVSLFIMAWVWLFIEFLIMGIYKLLYAD